MPSFETDLKKLQKLWDSAQQNGFNVETTRQLYGLKGQQLDQLPPRILSINNLEDTGGKYQDSSLLVDQVDGSEGSSQTIGILWTIVINNIPEDWIPMVRINIGYSLAGIATIGDVNDPTADSSFCTFVSVEYPTSTSPNPQNLVKATWSVMYTVSKDTPLKLYMTMVNPNLFV